MWNYIQWVPLFLSTIVCRNHLELVIQISSSVFSWLVTILRGWQNEAILPTSITPFLIDPLFLLNYMGNEMMDSAKNPSFGSVELWWYTIIKQEPGDGLKRPKKPQNINLLLPPTLNHFLIVVCLRFDIFAWCFVKAAIYREQWFSNYFASSF